MHYESYDAALAKMEQLLADGYRTLGNWPFGQILDHLARSVNCMIDGSSRKMPAVGRFFLRLLMKRRFLNGPLMPGFTTPKAGADFLPDDFSAEEGLERLKQAVTRLNRTSERAMHGGPGRLTNDEWDRFQLRHFELQMSFVVPEC